MNSNENARIPGVPGVEDLILGELDENQEYIQFTNNIAVSGVRRLLKLMEIKDISSVDEFLQVAAPDSSNVSDEEFQAEILKISKEKEAPIVMAEGDTVFMIGDKKLCDGVRDECSGKFTVLPYRFEDIRLWHLLEVKKLALRLDLEKKPVHYQNIVTYRDPGMGVN